LLNQRFEFEDISKLMIDESDDELKDIFMKGKIFFKIKFIKSIFVNYHLRSNHFSTSLRRMTCL